MSHELPPQENKCKKCGTLIGDSIEYCEKCKAEQIPVNLIKESFDKADKWFKKEKQKKIDEANQK